MKKRVFTVIFKVFRAARLGLDYFVCMFVSTKEHNTKEIKTQPHEFLKYKNNKNNPFCFVLIQYSLGTNIKPDKAWNPEEKEGGCVMDPRRQRSFASKTNSVIGPFAD